MATNTRRILGEHNVHRTTLSSPSAARRMLSLSVPHTPRLVVDGDNRADSAASKGKRHGHTRSLSQPVLLSDSSDSDGGKPPRAVGTAGGRPPSSGALSGRAPARASSPRKNQGVTRNRKALDRDKYRKALWDEEDDPARPAWLAMSSRSNEAHVDEGEGGAVKNRVKALSDHIVNELGRAASDEQAAASRRGASGRDSAAAPPSGPPQTPPSGSP